MARNTNRNNIEPMFRLIVFVVMIMFCLCWAVMALQRIKPGQSADSDGGIHSICCLPMFRMLDLITFLAAFLSGFALFALLITLLLSFKLFALLKTFSNNSALFALFVTFLSSFEIFGLMISFFVLFADLISTYFATASKPIFSASIFVKFRDWFGLFASSADFGYDLLSHNRLLIRRLRSEPIAPTIGVNGSFF